MSRIHSGSGKIVEAECVHEGGKFVLCNPSGRRHGIPDLFTVRFRAPADYQAGNVFVLHGKELPVLTQEMQSAPGGAFRAGAVVHADIDLACGRVFVRTGGSAGGGIGTETDPIYTADKPSLAPLASPAFAGTPTAPTAPAGTATQQLATTEFVNTAVEDATLPKAAAFAMVPDYANQDDTNQMPADGASFTVPADGFVVVARDGDAAARQSIMVDGVEAAGAAGSVAATLPVSAGMVVSSAGTGWIDGSCYYVPPKYVPVNRGYSTDEQLTGETWIDGRPVWRRTFSGVAPAKDFTLPGPPDSSCTLVRAIWNYELSEGTWFTGGGMLASASPQGVSLNTKSTGLRLNGVGYSFVGNAYNATVDYVKP